MISRQWHQVNFTPDGLGCERQSYKDLQNEWHLWFPCRLPAPARGHPPTATTCCPGNPQHNKNMIITLQSAHKIKNLHCLSEWRERKVLIPFYVYSLLASEFNLDSVITLRKGVGKFWLYRYDCCPALTHMHSICTELSLAVKLQMSSSFWPSLLALTSYVASSKCGVSRII